MRNSSKLLAPALITLALVATAVYASPHASCHRYSGVGMTSGVGILGSHIHDKLQLNPAQEKAWQNITAQAKALHAQRHDDRMQLKEALRAELAKTEPDLAKMSTLRDSLRARSQQAWKEIEAQGLEVYASLSVQQKAAVKEALLEGIKH